MSELTAAEADRLVAIAAAAAAQAGVHVAVVVLDAGGHLLAARRDHEAYYSAIPIATAKAFTSVNFRVPTHEMAERLGSTAYATQIALADPRLAIIKGGRPVVRDGRTIGAIGVSGGSAADDLACCDAAIADFESGPTDT